MKNGKARTDDHVATGLAGCDPYRREDCLQRQRYAGETLNFESPAAFFGQLTEKRWALVRTLQEAGELSVRELARRVERDVKRVHEDTQTLVSLGLFEKTSSGGLVCPYADIHVDMHLQRAA